MNAITFIVDYSNAKENVTKSIKWMSKIKKMKFGRRILQRANKYREEELNTNNILKQLLEIKQEYFMWGGDNGDGMEGPMEGDEGGGNDDLFEGANEGGMEGGDVEGDIGANENNDDQEEVANAVISSVLENEYKMAEGTQNDKEMESQRALTVMESQCSKRTDWTHLLDIFESLDLLLSDNIAGDTNSDLNFVDLLYCLGTVGIGIRVRRIAASNIDPWQLKVQYVAHVYNDSVSAMCSLDSALQTVEVDKSSIITRIKEDITSTSSISEEEQKENDVAIKQEELIPDIMMVLNRMDFKNNYFHHKLLRKVMRSDLYSIYLAAVFTRNPNAVIPSQKISILMIAFVQNVQQIFLRKWNALKDGEEMEIRKEINNALNIMYTIRSWVGNISEKVDNYWFGLIEKLKQENPGKFMTRSQEENVSSVCKVLCAICCFDESRELFAEHQAIRNEPKSSEQKSKLMQCRLSKIAIAMMGESTSRECRILVRNDEAEMWKLIGKGLGIYKVC